MRTLFVILLGISLLACAKTEEIVLTPDPQIEENDAPQAATLEGEWLHSFEEDNNDIKIYRPADTDFPTVATRERFVFVEEGKMYMEAINPDGSIVEIQGTWTLAGTSLEVMLEGEAPTRLLFTTDNLYKGKLVQFIDR